MPDSRLPLYMDIAQRLIADIEAGAYACSEYLPAERDLAEHLGVSRATLRSTLKRLETQGVLHAEHGRGHRILPRSGAGSQGDGLRAVALIMPFQHASTMQPIVRGCGAALNAAGYDIVQYDTTADTASAMRMRERTCLEGLRGKGLHGAIWWPSFPDQCHDVVRQAMASGVELVTIDRRVDGVDLDFVGVDNRAAARAAVEHLITEGHTQIMHITQAAPASTVADRRAGFEDAMAAHGIEPDEGRVLVWRSAPAERARTAHRLLASPAKPTALFCINDYVAVDVLLVLQDFGARVPDDIAIVGFDNARECMLVRPTLSTVAQPLAAIGETAGRMLLERIDRACVAAGRRLIMPTELIVRESSVRRTALDL